MVLTNHTAFEFVFASGFVLAPYGTLEIDNGEYAANISMRETVNRIYDGSAITVAGAPGTFPDWDALSEPMSAADASGVLSARGAGRYR